MNPILILVSLLGAFSLFGLQNTHNCGKSHVAFLVMFLIMAIINPLFSHNGVTVLFVMNNSPITLEATLYGVCAAAMIIASIYWFRSFSIVMTSDKLLYVFSKLSPKLSLVLSMALRYVPLFGQQVRKVQASQQALGLYKEDNLIDRLRGGMRVFSVMVTWTLENGIITADSMTARGYGVGKRSRFTIFRWTRSDVLLLMSTLLLTACAVWGMSGRTIAYYPAIAFAPVTARVMAGYIAYGCLTWLPAIINGKEAIKWRCLRSNI
jgi:energy-coupling factor transport system permease protein